MSVRVATVADAQAIGRVHVAAWRETYAGLMPEAVLARLSIDARARMWERMLSEPGAFDSIAVHLAERSGEVVGFGACGRQRTAALRCEGYDGEVTAIYVLGASQRRGVGRSLMQAMAVDLARHGLRGVGLWVLRDNAMARRFYDGLGGHVVGEQEDVREVATLVEVAYGWPDLTRLHGLVASRRGGSPSSR